MNELQRADWQRISADDAAWLDARYTLRTHDGTLIDVHNTGVRHGPAAVIARIAQARTSIRPIITSAPRRALKPAE